MLLKRIRHCFNMIEITLAIAIMGVGITSLMVLLPVGLRSSQESIANNYVPIIADYFMTMIRNRVIHDRTGTAGNYTYMDFDKKNTYVADSSIVSYLEEIKDETVSDVSKLPAKMYAINSDDGKIDGFNWIEPDDVGQRLSIGDVILGDASSPKKWKVENIDDQPTNIFVNNDKDKSNDYIVVFRSKSEAGGLKYDKVDFAAEVLLYKKKLKDADKGTSGYDDTDAARIIMHISWPIELPAAKRQSRVYTWDVAKGVFE